MVVPCHALALTTELPLDLLGAVEYLQWGERRGEYDRGIEEGVGALKAPRLRLDECSDAIDRPDEAVDGIYGLM